MTDKQIIIDGVDVSGCEHYEDLNCFAYRDSCGYPLDCKDNSNCYYKQLKRKEQECEELKRDLTDLSKIIDCKNGTILTFKEQLDQLKAKNEELKKILNEGCLHNLTLMTELRVLLQTLAEIKEIADKDFRHTAWEEYAKQLKQILQKISECEVENAR